MRIFETPKERLQFWMTWLGLGLLPLFMRPLWEPDEARYAEIPREILATGDWLTPRLNGVLYFEKPPLQYWLGAITQKLFGMNAAAARLPLALATFLAMLAALLLARRLGARRPVWASFMAATSLLGFICGQVLNLDPLFSAFLVLSVACAVEAVAARFEASLDEEPERRSQGRLWTLGAFASIAFALLTKGLAGPVLLGGAFMASLPFAWKDARLRRALLSTFFDPLGWLLFLLMAFPWFWFVEQAHPGHARFFFIHEHFARFTSTVHDREGSSNALLDKLYFAGVLLLGLLPWLALSLQGLRRGFAFVLRNSGPFAERSALHRWTVALALAAAAVPFVFFSLSSSKLPPYILPALVPILALACALEREGEESRTLRWHGVELLLLGFLFLLAAPALVKDLSGFSWKLLLLALAFLGVGGWALSVRPLNPRGLTAPRWMAALGICLLWLTLAAQEAAGARKSVAGLVKRAPAEAQWISHGNIHQGIAYYARTRVVMADALGELAYGHDRLDKSDQARWFFSGPEALASAARHLKAEDPSRPVWALSDRRAWKSLGPGEQSLWEVVDRSPSVLLLRLR